MEGRRAIEVKRDICKRSATRCSTEASHIRRKIDFRIPNYLISIKQPMHNSLCYWAHIGKLGGATMWHMNQNSGESQRKRHYE